MNKLRAVLLIKIFCGLLGAIAVAQKPPDTRTLLADLNRPKTTDRAARQLLQAATNDPRVRQFVAQQLPTMIRKPETDEIWQNAVRLAGQLKVTEAIPSLQEALTRGPLGGPMNTTFGTQMRLEDDIVAKALSQIGDPAIPSVAHLLQNKDPKTRRRAVLILRNMNSSEARKVMADHLPHETDPITKELIEVGLRS